VRFRRQWHGGSAFDTQRGRIGPPDVRFFAYATAYDSDRAIVIGHRPDGIDELAVHERHPLWRRVAGAFPTGSLLRSVR